jgi:hypothetical protein
MDSKPRIRTQESRRNHQTSAPRYFFLIPRIALPLAAWQPCIHCCLTHVHTQFSTLNRSSLPPPSASDLLLLLLEICLVVVFLFVLVFFSPEEFEFL